VGAGPNGLAAAIELARAGKNVLVCEARDQIGGGTRTAELTLPGFLSDVCSAIHPLGVGSPFLRALPLQEYGVEWIQPDAPLAHPLDDGTAVVLERSLEATAENLGRDGRAYINLMKPFVTHWQDLMDDLLSPLPIPPRHPIVLARFGPIALLSSDALMKLWFRGERARAIFTGMAAHSFLRMDQPISASFGMVLGVLAHAVGWPVPRGGSQQITLAMGRYLESLGGKIEVGRAVNSIDELPSARAYLFDVTPRQLLRIAGKRLPDRYLRALEKYRYGPGVFKVDWALDGPIPWTATECLRAGTVHIGSTMGEIARAERETAKGINPEKPFVLVGQQSLFDPTRAPDGKQVGWAYCHVPHGSTFDMTERIEAQIERFAPGFRDVILARHTMSPAEMERYNPNYVGGDINGGVQDIFQLFTRPTWRRVPYSTPTKGIYLCSSSTPPGGGVHGMCGYHAARAALKAVF
jgi:phytoene dehydrogenase-like protein